MDAFNEGVCPVCQHAPANVRTIEVRSCRTSGGSSYQLADCDYCKIQLKRRSVFAPWLLPDAADQDSDADDESQPRERKRRRN